MFEGLQHLVSLNRPLTAIARDIADITIVAFIIYRALLVLKGTRAMQMGVGFFIFGLLYMLAKYAELATLMSVLSWLASSIILIVVVVFQNDIRRALIRVGSRAWMSRRQDAQSRVIDEIVAAVTELARHRMGALIALERDANVLEFVKSDGIEMDSLVTRELLVSLFIPEAVNKTHDGAVLIHNLRVARAGVFFPMPESTKVVDPALGSRHRAAIGITEETDAVVIVVSEERGTITLCFPNGMVQNVDGASLRQALIGLLGGGADKAGTPLVTRLLRRAIGRPSASPPVSDSVDEDPEATPVAPSEAEDDASPEQTPPASKRQKVSSKPPLAMAPSSSKPPPPSSHPPAASKATKQTPTKTDAPKLAREDSKPSTEPAIKPASPEGSPRVSIPMRSSKERTPAEPAVTLPVTTPATISKPMAPTELPNNARSLAGDDS